MRDYQFSDLLRSWRNCLNYNLEEAAEILEVAQETLVIWEQGHNIPDESKLLAVTKLIRGDFIEMPIRERPDGWILPEAKGIIAD